MRITSADLQAVEAASREAFPKGTRVVLFGSRVDDERRGGDIDLLVELPEALPPSDIVDRRTRFAARLYRLLEEQRIDVVVTEARAQEVSPVVESARRFGIELTTV
jgi:uncharacterized protein